MTTKYQFSTQSIHCPNQDPHGALTPPIYSTVSFQMKNPGKLTSHYDYTRSGNPNFDQLSHTLAKLEKAKYCSVFSSGMAAITSILSSLKSGDLVITEKELYGPTYRIINQVFQKFGLKNIALDLSQQDSIKKIKRYQPALVWIETPTNPSLKILNIRQIATTAHQAKALLAVDNTFASSFCQQPLIHKADLSIFSTSKYISGHGASLAGAVCTNHSKWKEKLDFAQKAIGLNPSPHDAWLTSLGLKTLALRQEKHQKNALAFVKHLQQYLSLPHKILKRLLYPLDPNHPQHHQAQKQMNGGSGIVTAEFTLPLTTIKKLISSFKLFILAESFGTPESLVNHPATMTHSSLSKKERQKAGITDGLIRFSLGLEDSQDLIQDFETTLKKIL